MSRTHDAPSEKHNIDIKDILKDVEVCLKQGLERKISSFFDDYTMFQRTHNEVLNLSIVKKMLHVNGDECNHDHNEHYKRSETMYHDEYIISRYETEIETLKTENKNLSLELEKYKKYLTNRYIESILCKNQILFKNNQQVILLYPHPYPHPHLHLKN